MLRDSTSSGYASVCFSVELFVVLIFGSVVLIFGSQSITYKCTWVGAAKWGKNFADITCRKGLKNIRKQIKTKKHLEQMLVPLIKKHLKEKPKQTPRVIMKVLVLVGQFPVVS